MKKKFLFLLLISLVAVTTQGAKKEVKLKYNKDSSGTINQNPNRTPISLPIEVVFETETRTVDIQAPEELQGEASLFSFSGTLEDHSPVITSTLTATTAGVHRNKLR